MINTREIERFLNDALRSFRVHNNKSGFNCTIETMKLIWDDQNRMLNHTHDIYEVIAAAEPELDASGVYSAIHRVAEKAWNNNRALVRAYDQSLVAIPTNYELLEILLHYLEDPNREKYVKPKHKTK